MIVSEHIELMGTLVDFGEYKVGVSDHDDLVGLREEREVVCEAWMLLITC